MAGHVVTYTGDLNRAHKHDAGLDLASTEAVELKPGERKLVPTGVRVILPPDLVGMVCPRSGNAIKHGLTVLNAPGIIDSGYTGEVKVILMNLSDETHKVEKGDRVAQLVLTPVANDAYLNHVREEWFSKIADTQEVFERGEKGFGSSDGK